MTTAVAYLIIITSAWSGKHTQVFPFPSIEECRAAITTGKVVSQGDAIAMFCSHEKPSWWKP